MDLMDMDVINYLEAKTLGKKLVGIESEQDHYPLFRRNVLVFEDGTRVKIRLESGSVRMEIVPGERAAPVIEGRTMW